MATYDDIAALQLRSLCRALGLEHQFQDYLAIQQLLFEPWGRREVPAHPPYPCWVSDDHTPYEYSVAFGADGIECRILCEAQAETPSLRANMKTARAQTARLRERLGADLRRFDAIEDLFCPDDPGPRFPLWHAVCFAAGKKPEFKIYLNPQARGRERATDLAAEALKRLGFPGVPRLLMDQAAWRGPSRDVLTYLSLDLCDKPSARVKVYFCHDAATAGDIERSFAVAPTHRPGDVERFCAAIAGQLGPFAQKPVVSCFSFVEGSEAPWAVTFHLPIAKYASDDALVVDRMAAFLAPQPGIQDAYVRAIRAFAYRPLAQSVGLQSYVSFRREKSDLRFGVYLSPDVFRGAQHHANNAQLRDAQVKP